MTLFWESSLKQLANKNENEVVLQSWQSVNAAMDKSKKLLQLRSQLESNENHCKLLRKSIQKYGNL